MYRQRRRALHRFWGLLKMRANRNRNRQGPQGNWQGAPGGFAGNRAPQTPADLRRYEEVFQSKWHCQPQRLVLLRELLASRWTGLTSAEEGPTSPLQPPSGAAAAAVCTEAQAKNSATATAKASASESAACYSLAVGETPATSAAAAAAAAVLSSPAGSGCVGREEQNGSGGPWAEALAAQGDSTLAAACASVAGVSAAKAKAAAEAAACVSERLSLAAAEAAARLAALKKEGASQEAAEAAARAACRETRRALAASKKASEAARGAAEQAEVAWVAKEAAEFSASLEASGAGEAIDLATGNGPSSAKNKTNNGGAAQQQRPSQGASIAWGFSFAAKEAAKKASAFASEALEATAEATAAAAAAGQDAEDSEVWIFLTKDLRPRGKREDKAQAAKDACC